jgi:hypothetical protein
MAFTLNDNIPCGTEACATSKHESSACNSVDNVLISGIKDIKKGISDIEGKLDNIDVDLTPVAKEATLLAKVAELKEVLNSIDFTAIEQAIQNVEDVTAKEATLIQGVEDIIKAVENIDFTDLENSIAEVKNAVANIDFSALAKQSTLLTESQVIQEAIQNIDLSSVESKVEEESQAIQGKIDAIPATDLTEVAKEETLNTLANKIDNIKLPEIDTTELAKQGENQEATNSKIYDAVKSIPDLSLLYAARAEKNDDGVNTYSIVLPVTAKVTYDDNGVATIQL